MAVSQNSGVRHTASITPSYSFLQITIKVFMNTERQQQPMFGIPLITQKIFFCPGFKLVNENSAQITLLFFADFWIFNNFFKCIIHHLFLISMQLLICPLKTWHLLYNNRWHN